MSIVITDFWDHAKSIAAQSMLLPIHTYRILLLEWRRWHPVASEADALVAAGRLRRICGLEKQSPAG